MTRPTLAWLLPICATVALHAEFPMVGLQAAVVMPLKDLKAFSDTKQGTDLGLHMTFDQGDGNVLRPRLDWQRQAEVTVGGQAHRASSLSLGGDYLYFSEGAPERFYVFIGAALNAWSFHTSPGDLILSDGTSLHTSATKLSLGLGLGYQWTSLLGTELRYSHCKPASAFTADTVQAGVTLRF
jgi:hypothetical protein